MDSGKGSEILATFTGNGGLGEEIAAIGDLKGDGLSEILAGAPDGGYAFVVSFAQIVDRPRLSIHRQAAQVVLTWPEGRADWRLEQSGDLQTWTSLRSPVEGSRSLEIEIQAKPTVYFRMVPPSA